MSSEMLSAALDGECSAEELDQLLQALERSPELKEQWSRLCLARDALNGAQLAAPGKSSTVCAEVMRAIGETSPSEKVVAFTPKRRLAAAWRPLIGLATAAGVASVAFYLGYHTPNIQPVGAATVQAKHADGIAKLAPVLPAKAVTVSQSGWESVDQEADARQLNNYLIDYSSYRSGAGMADTLGYARFAAHTAEYNPER